MGPWRACPHTAKRQENKMPAYHSSCREYHMVEIDDLGLFVECPKGKVKYIDLIAANK